MADSDIPALEDVCSARGDNESDDSDGWDELEESGGEQTRCLFCPLQFRTLAVALDHCRTSHNFDLLSLKTRFNMDCYSYIKLINFIRMHNPTPSEILEPNFAIWDDDKYIKPSGEVESWLMYDFDDLGSAPSTPSLAIDGKTPLNQGQFSDLVRDLMSQLQNAMADINKMKEVAKNIVSAGDNEPSMPSFVGERDATYDSDYFSSYSHFGIHHEMLSDKVRTESYRNAILNNKDFFSGKQVLDIGCGTGILSMFAAEAGSDKVTGIDMSEVVYKAMDIIRENKMEDKVELIKGRLEDTELPGNGKFDIIISEWMGYFLLFEGMLDSVIYARDHHLKEDGLILPNRCNISIVGIDDKETHNKLIGFWDNVYGFNMKCMKPDVLSEAHVETVPSDKIITNANILTEIDIKTCTTQSPYFSSPFKFEIIREGEITAIAGYFDTFFDLDNKVEFSTGPHALRTHWQQTVFYLPKTIPVKTGDVIEGTFACSRAAKNVRGLTIFLNIAGNKYEYKMH